MKNAMKKLTSLLLVAVLLVSAIPFGALAAEFNPTAFLGTSTDVAASAAEPAPVAETTELGNSTPSAQTQAEPNNQFAIAVVYVAPAEAGLQTGTINSKVEPGNAWKIARELQGKTADEWTALSEKYDITYTSGGNAVTAIDSSVSTFTVTLTAKPVVLKQFLVTVKVDGTSISADKAIEEGTVLTLDASLLSNFGLALPAGQVINMFKEVKGGVVGDVISGSYTVDKDVEIRVVTVPGNAANNGTTGGTTGGNLNGGTTTGGNVAPNGTVIFKDYNGNAMYTANLYNGKLTAQDINNATNAANRSGYTFNGWLVNGNGSAAASDLLLNMTFSNGDFLVPSYTQNAANSILTSTKDMNDIFLNIFVNKDFQHCKTIKLNDHWVIADDKVTKDEILQYVVTDYYKASNGNLGLQADKLYYSIGSFMYNWLTDNGTLTIDNISTKRAQGTVTINIMVTNAVAKTGAAADTSNPKTGDNIYTAMTVMGLSAASLAAVMFFYNKKRYTV